MLSVLFSALLLAVPSEPSLTSNHPAIETGTASADSPVPHVRSEDPQLLAVVREAATRSRTLQQLIAAIDGSDGLVYLQRGQCLHGVFACLPTSVVVAGPFRILRIVIDARKAPSELVSSIGHELQHAVEALNEPNVRTSKQMYHFFERIGPTGRGLFETPEALHAGWQIAAELNARGGTIPSPTQK